MRRVAILPILLATLGLYGVVSTESVSAETSEVRGQLISDDVPIQTAMILVVASDVEQPVVLEAYAPISSPNFINDLPTHRQGPGLVRNDPSSGDYSVTGLAAGSYWVATTANFQEDGTLPPEAIQASIDGHVFSMYAFAITLGEGETLTVDFDLGTSVGDEAGSMEVCAITFDRDTLEAGLPDVVVDADIVPIEQGQAETPTATAVNPDQAGLDAITISITESGCALYENVPPGTYLITVQTERGFTLTDEVTFVGQDGHLELFANPPQPGGLPSTGSGGRPSAPVLIHLMVGVGLLVIGSLSLFGIAREAQRHG